MHTEFCRERVQPGQLVIGSDSYTCSGGSVSALAIGLGVADVLLPLVTGETWLKVPATVEIRFMNKPKPGTYLWEGYNPIYPDRADAEHGRSRAHSRIHWARSPVFVSGC